MSDGIDIQCGDCGAHYQLDPGGDVQGAACDQCGGKRFFRTQPSPTRSDGDLRDMPGEHDPVAGEDPGGFPLGEGNIVGSPGSRGDGIRPGRGGLDGYSKVAMPREKYNLDPEWQPELEIADQYPQDIYDQHRGVLEGFERWVPPPGVENADPPGNWKMKFRENAEPNPNGTWTPTDEMGTTYIDPATLHGYKLLKGKLPQIPPELQGHLQPTLPEGEPPIEGHGTLISRQLQKVEPMNTLNMEPYEPLWHESYLPPKTAGPLMEAIPAIGSLAARAMPTLMKGVMFGGGTQMGKDMMGGGGGQGQQAGGMAPQGVTPAPSLDMVSKTTADIPLLLLSAMDTPHSVKSVGEQHDDPEEQDQKEFNDGDHDPNLKNPNNDDSGAMGEDAVRQSAGFAPDSPGIERAMMVLPLLLHYFNSDESGESDPLIRALHQALEQENPDYLKQEDPEGEQLVQQLMQHHKSPHGVTAGANAFPSGLPAMPGTGMDTPQTQGANGTCPTCGAALAADGSCPQCGAKQQPQGGQVGTQGGGFMPGTSTPPNAFTGKVGTSGAGPQTEQQKQAVRQLLEMQGRMAEVPLVDTEPWRFHEELNQIQRNPNVAPLVDPSQAQPSPAPMGQMGMPGGGGAPGAMPVMDPSQMGGGGGMPMQPMSRTADTYGPDTSWPRELPRPHNQNAFHYMEPGESAMGQGELGLGRCPKCGKQSLTPYNGMCNNCGFVMPKDSPDVALPQYDPQGSHTLSPGEMDEGSYVGPHWGRTAADTIRVRCPECNSGSTSIQPGSTEDTTTFRCHSCGKIIDNFTKQLDMEKYKASGLNADSRVALVDVPNPILENAAERTDVHPEMGQDASLIWKDAKGDPIRVGETYDMKTAGMPYPEPVKVISRKPDELGVKLVGEFSNVARDQGTPDWQVTPYDIQSGKYSFIPMGQPQDSPEQPIGGMPGLEQIPQSGPTTDESSHSYPNEGTVSHVAAEEFDDLCHKCGCDWITHTASSETSTMHECARCGSVWETRDEFDGYSPNSDLSWIYESSNNDDFWSGMERTAKMREGGQSRSIAAAVSKDDRYQRIHDILEQNRQSYGGFGKLAGRHFTPGEQRELINERGSARNADLLDLTGTHYNTVMGYDARDPRGRANEMNAPDEHLVLGL